MILLLRKGRTVAISNDPQKVYAELGRQAEARAELREIIEFHRAVLEIQLQVFAPTPAIEFGADQVRASVEAGIPLLSPEVIVVPNDAFAALYNAICSLVATYRPELADEVKALRKTSANEQQVARKGWLLSANGQNGAVSDLERFMLVNTWRPFLWPYAITLAPLIEDEQWYRGQCPVCGGEPDLAALVDEGQRWLLCSRCDTEWRYRRIGCPFCNNTDHRKLVYYTGESPVYRLYVCETCRRYLKAVDQREHWQRRPLPVERILTIGMDVAAVEAGYT